MALTEELASFATSIQPDMIPEGVADVAKRAILDCLGCTLAGARTETAKLLLVVLDEAGGGKPESTILGTTLRANSWWAALVNGTLAHALDYDDSHRVLTGHPSAAVLPAALALAERVGATGRDLLAAYVAGAEVAIGLGAVMNPEHYARGWHATSTVGTIGAAAAGCRILGLAPHEAGVALAIAASLACGLQENFGTMTKPLHAGKAASNGVLSALLAAKGWTAGKGVLEAQPRGFLSLFGASNPPGAVVESLGNEFRLQGMMFKKYPSCAATHPAIDAALAVRADPGFAPTEVEEVQCSINNLARQVLVYDHPATPLEAKFSLPYCVAVVLVHGKVGVDAFAPASLADARVQAMMGRVRKICAFEVARGTFGPAEVEVRLRDGRVVRKRVEMARGEDAPLEWDELIAKFEDCTSRTLPLDRVKEAVATVRRLEDLGDVRELTRVLAG